MAFNPDDFQFEKILPPEEKKPILEWDALHRLIVVRVKEDGEWAYYATKLSAQVNTNLLNNLPNEWSNENDRVVSFSVFDDGNYIFDKEKLKFNFSTQTAKWVRYEYDKLSSGQVKEFLDIMKAALAVNKADNEIVQSKAIVDIATAEEYLTRIDETRSETKKAMLRGSDWTQLPDATETFSGELELWTIYRRFLNENVKVPADFDDVLDYLIWDETFEWPIDPFKYHQLDPEHATEYLTDSSHFVGSVFGTGTYASEQLGLNIKQSAILAKQREAEGGLPINKQIWDKIQQYNLNNGLTGAVIENLQIVEN